MIRRRERKDYHKPASLRNYDHLPEYPAEIAERSRASREAKRSLRSLGERADSEQWGRYIGRDLPLFYWESAEGDKNNPERLRDLEKILAAQIIKLVGTTKPDQLPVVIVNIGGMWDRSLIAVAQFLNDAYNWVDNGTIALVSTNLAFTIDQGLETIEQNTEFSLQSVERPNDGQFTFRDRISEPELEFIRDNHRLIHSIQSNMAELRRKKITVPSDQGPREIVLNGMVDLVVEAHALMHSIRGETDFFLLGKVMRPQRGIMLLHSDSYESKTGQGGLAQHYTDLIHEGMDTLKSMGYKHLFDPRKYVVEGPTYHVFAANPKLTIDFKKYRDVEA